MPWRRWVPSGERTMAAARASALAHELVAQGVEDAEAVVQLRAVPGGRRVLVEVAAVNTRFLYQGYPYTRIHRLLRVAAGDPLLQPTDEEAAIEARQRQMWEPPFDDSFRQLAGRVPALLELEERASSDPASFLRGLKFHDTGRIGGPPLRADSREGQAQILAALHKAVRRLVGPRSGLSDPVLGSAAAERAAWQYLRGGDRDRSTDLASIMKTWVSPSGPLWAGCRVPRPKRADGASRLPIDNSETGPHAGPS
jgi:hypothetical protein